MTKCLLSSHYSENNKISQVDIHVDEKESYMLKECIDSRWLTEGKKTEEFSEMIRHVTGAKFVTFAPNGTLGLFLSLLALDLPRGSEVIIPDFTFFACASSCVFAGLKPVFVDVRLDTFSIDVSLIEKAITKKTKAIMPVHIYGQACDMDPIMALAKKYNLRVIEDSAQGFGVKYKGRHVGTMGEIGMFSFFSDKVITTGEGAALVTNNNDLFRKIKLLRNQGREHSGTFIHEEIGMNFRTTDMQSAIGIEQIKKFPEILSKRLDLCELYSTLLKDIPKIECMKVASFSNFVPFRFCITSPEKDKLEKHMNNNHIMTRSFFYPMHLQPKLSKYKTSKLSNSVRLYETGLCLPVHYNISKEDVYYICETIRDFFINKK